GGNGASVAQSLLESVADATAVADYSSVDSTRRHYSFNKPFRTNSSAGWHGGPDVYLFQRLLEQLLIIPAAQSVFCVNRAVRFFLYGLMRVNWGTVRLRWSGYAALYLTLAILALQAVFSSFQERYLLPLLPLVCLYAGHGLGTWERRMEKRGLRFWVVAGPALG